MTKTVTINGRTLTVRSEPDDRALATRATGAVGRIRITRGAQGELCIVPDHTPLPGPLVIDAPRFIYG